MANAYTLSLNKVYTNLYSGTEKAYQIDVDLGASRVEGATFTMTVNGAAFTNFSSVAAATGTIYTLTFNAGSELLTTDYITLVAAKDLNFSDKLLTDFTASYTNGSSAYNYALDTAGTYSFKLDKVDEADFSTAPASSSFIVTDAANVPYATNSSITLLKSYLVHFTGETILASVNLNTQAGTPVQNGGYEVSFYADLA